MIPRTVTFGQAMWLCLLFVVLACVVASFVYGQLERLAMLWYAANQPRAPQQSRPWYVHAFEFLNQ